MSRFRRGTVFRAPAPYFQVRLSILLDQRCSSFILLCRPEGASVNLKRFPPRGVRPLPLPKKPLPALPGAPASQSVPLRSQSMPDGRRPLPKPPKQNTDPLPLSPEYGQLSHPLLESPGGRIPLKPGPDSLSQSPKPVSYIPPSKPPVVPPTRTVAPPLPPKPPVATPQTFRVPPRPPKLPVAAPQTFVAPPPPPPLSASQRRPAPSVRPLPQRPQRPQRRELLRRVDQRNKLATRGYVWEPLTTPMVDLD